MENGHRVTSKDVAVAQRHGLSVPKLGSFVPSSVPKLQSSYRPLGANPKTLDERTHSLQSQSNQEESTSAPPPGTLTDHPFKVVDYASGGAARVTIQFGQVNSVTPTVGGTSLATVPAPTLNVSSGFVYLDCFLDTDGDVTSVTVQNAASVPASSFNHAYIALAAVTVSGSTVTVFQSVTHSLQMRRCAVADMHFWGI